MITFTLTVLAVFGFTMLIKKFFARDLQEWSHAATIAGGLAAALSIAWAALTFYEGARLQRELTAANLYREHLELSLEYPFLANLELKPDSTAEITHVAEQYEWYIGHALYTFETIMDAKPKDPEWKAVAQGFVREHSRYIGSERLPCGEYTRRLRKLLNETLDPDPCPANGDGKRQP